MRWMKNTDGKPDAVLTMSFVAFLVVAVKYFLSGFILTIGSTTLQAEGVDGGAIAALLTPTLGAYVARRYTDKVSARASKSSDPA